MVALDLACSSLRNRDSSMVSINPLEEDAKTDCEIGSGRGFKPYALTSLFDDAFTDELPFARQLVLQL
jgi:hypothetical protein